MNCGVGCRSGSDLALLWLWRRPEAIVPIRSLAWEPSYAVSVAKKEKKKKKKKKKKYSGKILETLKQENGKI